MRNRTICVYLALVAMCGAALSQPDAQTTPTTTHDVIALWKHESEVERASIELTRQGKPEPVELANERLRLRQQLTTMQLSLTNEQRDAVAIAVIGILTTRTPERWSLTLDAIDFLSTLNINAYLGRGLSADVRLQATNTLASIAQLKNENYFVRRWAVNNLPQLDPDSIGVAALASIAREPQELGMDASTATLAVDALGGYDTIEAADALLAMWNDPAMRSRHSERILYSLSSKKDDRAYRVVSTWLNDADMRRNGPVVPVLLGQGQLAIRLDRLETPTADQRQRLEEIRSRFISILRRADEVHPEVLEQAAEQLAWVTPPDNHARIELLHQIMLKLPKPGSDDIRWGLMKAAKRHSGRQP